METCLGYFWRVGSLVTFDYICTLASLTKQGTPTMLNVTLLIRVYFCLKYLWPRGTYVPMRCDTIGTDHSF